MSRGPGAKRRLSVLSPPGGRPSGASRKVATFALVLAGVSSPWPGLAGPQASAQEDPHAHHRAAAEAGGRVEVARGQMTIPDLVLLDQDGGEVRFYSDLVKDRIVVINSIFTTCTTICPPMGANFAKLQQLLGNRVGKDLVLISVSVDPLTDTPQRLKAWSAKFGAGPGWTLVTGPKREIDKLLKALKLFTADKEDHAPIVLVGNEARGVWSRTYGLAPPAALVKVIEKVSGTPEIASDRGENL